MRILFSFITLLGVAFGQIQTNGTLTVGGTVGTFGIISTPVITTTTLPNGTQGSPYVGPGNVILESGGTAPFTWAIISGALPAGLSLNASTGAITGTPTTPGANPFTVTVTDTNGLVSSPQNLSIQIVASSVLTLQAASLPRVTQNTVYPATPLTATGGTTPRCFTLVSGAPTGLTIGQGTISGGNCTVAGSGILGGTVTAAPATFASVLVRVTDHVGATATQAYSITVLTPGSGPPTAYTHARTDLCETGLEAGCTGLGMIFDGSPATMAQVPVLWETNVTASCPSPPCHRIGLNKTATDPDFGAFFIRASDKFSPCNNGQFGINGASGGDVPWVGLTDTTLAVPSAMFLLQSSGQRDCLNYYKPSTHSVLYSQIIGGGGANGTSTQFASGAAIAMSGMQPTHVFELISLKSKDVINELTIDNNPASGTFDTITKRAQIADLINNGPDCLPASYATLAASPWTGTFNVSADDSAFTLGIGSGNQGTAFEAVRVSPGKSGCRYFAFSGANTGVKGDFGCHYTAGAGMGTCTADTPGVIYHFVTDNPDICGANPIPCSIDDQFLLHGVQQSPDPAWFNTGVANSACTAGHQCSCNKVNGGCQEYFFLGDTNLVEPCSICAGHTANGVGFAYKQPGGGILPLRRILRSRPTVSGNPNPGTVMSPTLPSDYHGSGNAETDASDSAPIALALADTLSTNTQGAGWTNRPPYASAFYGEIVLCSTLTPGTCFRPNHSFNSTLEQAFAPVENIFIESPEGTWGLMMSDWMGNFGSYTDLNTCNMVGGDAFKTSHAYVLNDEISLAPAVAHGANLRSVSFKVTTAGTSGSSIPATLANMAAFNTRATYVIGDYVSPTNNNSNLDIFQVTTPGKAGTEPNWDSACGTSCSGGGGVAVFTNVGSTVTDTGSPSSPKLVFTFEGLNNCSGDAVIVDLTPLI